MPATASSAAALIQTQRETAQQQALWARVTQVKCRDAGDLIGEDSATDRIDKALDKLLELRGR